MLSGRSSMSVDGSHLEKPFKKCDCDGLLDKNCMARAI
jgi:hypothetical protein